MSDALILDPEIEGLLREVAADPRSTLLRVPRRAVPPGVFDHDPRVTAMAAGLTSAERHLLQAHRAELALLLRQGAVMVLHQDPDNDWWLDKFVSKRKRLVLPSKSYWEQRASKSLRLARGSAAELSGLDLVSACIEHNRQGCTTTQLAVASLRLWPNDEARIDVGMDAYRSGGLATALRLYRSVLSGIPTPMNRCCVLQNMALAYSGLGRQQDAADASRAAALEPVEIVEPALNAQYHAMTLGDRSSIVEAATKVDALVPEDSPVLELFVSQLRQQRLQGDWEPTPESRAAVSRARQLFRISSTKVADATLQSA